VEAAVREITTTDVRDACDLFREVWEQTGTVDGRVSIEVDPRLANDTEGTIAEALDLWKTVDRPNLLVKIPATPAGLPAITKVIGEGVSVNVTLIFSLERYQQVMDAYLAGLELAKAAGHDLSRIHSVASFFVSRVDAEVDKRLDALGTPEARALRGQAAVANARLAYAAFQQVFATDRATALTGEKARPQRPLWASTGVKDPAYPDTKYVDELVVANTVNTMPEKTLLAFADHGEVPGDTVTGRAAEAQQVFDELTAVGIDIDDVYDVLEREGVEKFDKSWAELLETVKGQLDLATS
jgi:transaldolase